MHRQEAAVPNELGTALDPDAFALLELLLAGSVGPAAYEEPAVAGRLRAALGLEPGDRLLVPAVLRLPAAGGGAVSTGSAVNLLDPEGATVGVVDVARSGVLPDGSPWVAGPVRRAAARQHTDWTTWRRAPGAADLPQHCLAAWLQAPSSRPERQAVRALAASRGLPLLWLVPLPPGEEAELSAHLAPRLARAAQDDQDAAVVVVPAPRDGWTTGDLALRARIAAAYGADALVVPARHLPSPAGSAAIEAFAGIPLLGVASGETGPDELVELARSGAPVPDSLLEGPAVDELRRVHRPRSTGGVTVLFSGLSGSGKSTIAKALVAVLLSADRRPVTLLDGDVIRRHLSSGLGFDRAGRDANVRRIGFVAAEVTKAGGIAVCAPIAPFDATRRDVRAMVEAHGSFVLVHVSTPLEECERRDRKGLYARARRGEIEDFTGISSPYEEPEDAELVVDTTGRPIEDALADVITGLRALDVLPATQPPRASGVS